MKSLRICQRYSLRALAAFLGSDHLTVSQVLKGTRRATPARVRHWTAEGQAVVRDAVHFEMLRLCLSPEFRPDCWWIAQQSGTTVDDANLALDRLLRLELIELAADGTWRDRTGLERLTSKHEQRGIAVSDYFKGSRRDGAVLWLALRVEHRRQQPDGLPAHRDRIGGRNPGRHLARASARDQLNWARR